MMDAPPLFAGAEKATDADAFPGVATTDVGTSGTETGVTELDAALAGPVPPAEFVAVTVNVYAVPFVRPVTVIGDAEPVA